MTYSRKSCDTVQPSLCNIRLQYFTYTIMFDLRLTEFHLPHAPF